MRSHILILSTAIILLIASCQSQDQEAKISAGPVAVEAVDPYKDIPVELKNGLEAHGGLQLWKSFSTVGYDLIKNGNKEHQLIELQSRKVLLTSDTYKVGFDGKEVWVSPDMKAFGRGSARFYHNLNFYFFAIPHVFGDPGINFEVLPEKTIEGKSYDVVKISFSNGVGDASGDYYVAHFDQETHRLHLLLYTVTYYSNKSSENYNAIIYHEWQKVNGLLVPKVFKGYKYANGEIGEQRYEAQFDDVKFDVVSPDPSIFEMPENAVVDSLNNAG